MKIGVLTWYFGFNYGAEAHSYALMKTIEQLGHDVKLIRYRPSNSLKIDITSNLNVTNRKRHPILLLRCMVRCLKFSIGKKRYKQTRKVKNSEDIKKLGLDCVVLGSDEILNIHHQIHDPIYYGVGLEDINCIYYAPSAGQTDYSETLPNEDIYSIRLREYVSGRDYNTVALLQKYSNRDVQLVLDPTLLYDFSHIAHVPTGIDHYILIYAFSEWEEYKDQIVKYANENHLKIVSVRRYYKWVDYNYDMCDFGMWLGMFKKAELVFTDSFHGLIFAIKNKKEFVVVSRSDKVNKINDLEKELGIIRPFMDSSEMIDDYLKRFPLDYDQIDRTIDSLKAVSMHYLEQSLSMRNTR